MSSEDDTIKIGTGTLSGSGFRYAPGANGGNLTIQGAGADKTILTGVGIYGNVLEVNADASNHVGHVEDLGFSVTRNTGYTSGLAISRGLVERVHATSPGTIGYPIGIRAGGGTVIKHSVADVGQTGFAGFELLGDPMQVPSRVEDSTAIGRWGILVESGPGQVSRTHVRATQEGIEACNTEADVDDTVIELSGKYALGLAIQAGGRCSATPALMKANHVTIVGDGSPMPAGVAALQIFADPYSATLNLRHSIIRNVAHTITWRTTGSATATIGSTDANLSAGAQDGTPGTLTLLPGNIDADPRWVDSLSGDYRLLFDSPAIDAGPSEPFDLWESPLDILGQPRLVDGNGDGSAKRDMGAYEYQHRPPHARAAALVGTNGQGQPVSLTAAGSSDPDPGDSLTYDWTFDDGKTATGLAITHAFRKIGAHTATVTVKDPTGLTAAATATVQVTARCIVPRLVGLSLRRAKRKARAAHCGVGKITRRRSRLSAGRVVSQRPRAGKNLPPGSKVSLVVAAPRRHR